MNASRFALLGLLAACDAPDAATPDAPNGADAGTNPTTDAVPAPTHQGSVDVYLDVDGFSPQSSNTYIRGGFIKSWPATCTTQVVGACHVERCTSMRPELAAPGYLRVTGGEFGNLGWDPGPFPIYYQLDAIPVAAGETVTLRSDGEDLPAFTLSTTGPATLDAGFDGPINDLPLTRTQPLRVTWTPRSGTAAVEVTQSYDNRWPTTIRCIAPATSGTFDVPTAALSALETSTLDNVEVRTWLVNSATVNAGDYAVELRVLRGFDDQIKRYQVQ